MAWIGNNNNNVNWAKESLLHSSVIEIMLILALALGIPSMPNQLVAQQISLSIGYVAGRGVGLDNAEIAARGGTSRRY